MTIIHPTAFVDASAQLHDSVTVGPYAVIGPDVIIGPGTTIGHHAWLEHSIVGANNKIFPYAVIGAPPQDIKYDGKKTAVKIGDDCVIREFATIHRATNPEQPTSVGNKCYLMAGSHIGHDCQISNNVIIANSTQIGGHVVICDNVIISALVGLHQFVRVGRFVMLGGGAMASQDIPPFTQAQGDRAKLVGLNMVGLKRGRFSMSTISEIKSAYKEIFLSGLPMQEALDQIAASEPCPEVKELVDFIINSKRGVCHPRYKEIFSEDE